MKKSESRYFHTAVRMDQAFLELLDRKDMEYITVKEICEKAGVNRSTFYLHYENIGDLLSESIRYMNDQFLEHMNLVSEDYVSRIGECPVSELYLVTPEYLTPYLEYIAQNKRLFRTALKKSSLLELDKTYSQMVHHVFVPILERFQIAEPYHRYMIEFYIHGLMAILSEWLKNDCRDSIRQISEVMEQCVMGRNGKESSGIRFSE